MSWKFSLNSSSHQLLFFDRHEPQHFSDPTLTPHNLPLGSVFQVSPINFNLCRHCQTLLDSQFRGGADTFSHEVPASG